MDFGGHFVVVITLPDLLKEFLSQNIFKVTVDDVDTLDARKLEAFACILTVFDETFCCVKYKLVIVDGVHT